MDISTEEKLRLLRRFFDPPKVWNNNPNKIPINTADAKEAIIRRLTSEEGNWTKLHYDF